MKQENLQATAGIPALQGGEEVKEARPAEGGVQSVHRALDVLEALAVAGGTASLRDLAAACGLPTPTLHRPGSRC